MRWLKFSVLIRLLLFYVALVTNFFPFHAHVFIVPSLISSPISILTDFFPTQKAGNLQEYIPCVPVLIIWDLNNLQLTERRVPRVEQSAWSVALQLDVMSTAVTVANKTYN